LRLKISNNQGFRIEKYFILPTYAQYLTTVSIHPYTYFGLLTAILRGSQYQAQTMMHGQYNVKFSNAQQAKLVYKNQGFNSLKKKVPCLRLKIPNNRGFSL
jgi:hypothetical protein